MPPETLNTARPESAPVTASPARWQRPGLYFVLIVLAIVGAFVYKQRALGIFACGTEGYGPSTYLADCAATAYGDYDHGAFWFGLEPHASRRAASADVLMLGSSRLQFAMSTPGTVNWFAEAGLRHYLLGFSHSETTTFTGPLLSRLAARPKAVVINVDRFFEDRATPPMAQLQSMNDIEARYHEKRQWQRLHRAVCSNLPLLCGSATAVFRDRDTGAWRMFGRLPGQPADVSIGPAAASERWPGFAAVGERFLGGLNVERDCVILTLVPTVASKRAEAEAIAAALGLPLVAPVVDGLRTFDGSHLDAASAARWSAAFLEAAGPRLRQCGARGPGR